MQLPTWKANAFAWHAERLSLSKYGYTEQEVLALAYLQGIRREVVQNNFTWLCSISGRHRAGKTLVGCMIGYLMDSTFYPNFERRVIYSPKDFMQELRNIRIRKIKGAVMLIDEAGASVSSMDWFERWQKALAKATIVLGYLNPIILFAAPIRDFVNSPIRKMFHAHLEINRFNREYCIIRPYEVKFNTTYKKTFWRKPIIKFAGQKKTLDKIRMGYPPQFIIDRYEALEKLEKDKILEDLQKDVNASEADTAKKTLNLEDVIKHVTENPEIYQTKSSKPANIILDARAIRFKFSVAADMAQHIKSEAERAIRAKQEAIREEIGETAPPLGAKNGKKEKPPGTD
jgi:hypothetical protein